MTGLPSGRPTRKQRGGRGLGRAYQGAVEAVAAIGIAAALGAFADSRFGTSPLLLLLGLATGFAAFVLRLVRLLQEPDLQPPDDAARRPPDGE